MSRRAAKLALTLVVLVFLLGVADAFINPLNDLLPEQFVSVAAVVLSGVAVGSILAGLRANGNGGRRSGAGDESNGVDLSNDGEAR